MASDVPLSANATLLEYALGLVERGRDDGFALRLCGGLGCCYHESDVAQAISVGAGRTYSDLDLVAYFKDRERVDGLLRSLEMRESTSTGTVPGARRAKFVGPTGLHVDVFYDVLDFCHPIDLRSRLEASYPTIPLADLLLQKTQIVDLAPKDIVDLQMLLHDHEFAVDDSQGISTPRVAALTGSNWGLYHTTTISIAKCVSATESTSYLTPPQRERVLTQLEALARILDSSPKSMRWRARSVVGERLQWYETVEHESERQQ